MSVTNRQRSIPPSMFNDEVLIELEPTVRLTGIGLHYFVDDSGRASANAAMIKGALWPLEKLVTEDDVTDHLLQLEEVGYIRLYVADGRTLLSMQEWPSTDRGKPSRLPAPPPLASPSRGSREGLAVVGGERREGERGGGEGGEGEAAGGGAPRLPTEEPSPFCAKHPTGTDHPCGPCGTARKRLTLWQRAQADAEASNLDGDG